MADESPLANESPVLFLLRAPPEGFSHVTRSHFYYKRDTLIKVRPRNKLYFSPYVSVSFNDWYHTLIVSGARNSSWNVQIQGHPKTLGWSQDRIVQVREAGAIKRVIYCLKYLSYSYEHLFKYHTEIFKNVICSRKYVICVEEKLN